MTRLSFPNGFARRALLGVGLALAVCEPVQTFGQGAAPFGAPAGGAPAAAAPVAEAAPVVDNPAVEALLATNPQSPEDLLNVSLLLVDLKYPKVARPLFDKLLEAVVDEEQLAALGRSAGSTKINRLADIKEFQPQGADFVKRVVAATNKANRDPARLAELVERLKQPSVQTRATAIVLLRSGGDAAAQALLDVLLDSSRAPEHRTIAAALAGIGSEGVGPLAALATHGTESQRVLALDSLGYVEPDAAEPGVVEAPLFAAAFGSSSTPAGAAAEAAVVRRRQALPKQMAAAAELYLQAKHSYFTKPAAIDLGAPSAVWHWDAGAKKPVRLLVTRHAAALDRAATLARAASDIAGNDPTARQLARAAALEASIDSTGTDAARKAAAAKSWYDAEKPSVPELERLLDKALENQRSEAAVALVRLIAAVSGPAALDSLGGKPAPLVRAAAAADRRVRFAALEEILKLGANKPFAGSSGASDALGYFAAATGARKALVVDANLPRARDIAGIVNGLGYQCEAVSDARSAMRLVTADPDYELLLMYRPLLDPVLGQLLSQLRADYRTAQLPVAVYCEPNDVERTRSTVRNDRLAAGIYQPRATETLLPQLAELNQASQGVVLTSVERIAQAQAALAAMGRLVDVQSKVFNTRRYEPALLVAAWSPVVGKQAVGVLGMFGSAAAQRTLADVASAAALPLDVRQQSAKAFCESVIRFGTLLTTTEIQNQYERYNASAVLDRPTQELLAAILDAIEARIAKIPAGRKPLAIAPPAKAAPPAEAVPSATAPEAATPTTPAAAPIDPFAAPASPPPSAPAPGTP